MTASPLPQPRRPRWQPLRGGLLNLYRYDHEEFWFEDGHLLLRGNNGTGKSRVLALQLPFLLDGEVSPFRMEPDGDPAKHVDWNLLMGKYADRQGYTWIEFGRRDDDGEARFLTLGCGLRAVEGRGLAKRWFFVTGRRVGEDLFLQGSSGEALSRERLAEVLDGRGEVLSTATDYRAAVDRELFRLGRQRYEALVNLLIQLRQPQLSRKLDEVKLSQALSEALPPLDAHVVADVAESFRSLQADREALNDLRTAARGVDEFLAGYRRYAQVAARRRAEQVRTRHSAYEHTQRQLRAAEERRDAAARDLDAVADERRRLAADAQAADAEVRTLEARPEMRDKHALDAARQRAEERGAETRRAAEELEQAADVRRRHEAQATEATAAAEASRETVTARLDDAAHDARAAALETVHRRTVDALGPPEVDDPAAVDAAETRLEEATAQRQRGVRHVRRLAREVERADEALRAAKDLQTTRAAELDEAGERQRRAHAALTSAADALLAGYDAWRRDLAELAPPAAGELAEVLRDWSQQPDGPSPVNAAVRAAEAAARERLAHAQAGAAARRDAAGEELAHLRAEREALRAGVHRPPPAPYTRAEGTRDERPGAPLWRACDFAPDVDAATRAGVEAALEAAGLLDAWITPDGRLLDAADHDTVLVAATSREAPADRGLDRLLRPAAGAGVAAETVTAVLRHVGLGDGAGEVWVDAGGRFQVGPLHGAWSKPAAQHVGAEAREAERRRRLAALDGEIADAEARLDALAAELAGLHARRDAARREADAAPGDDAVLRAAADLDAAGVVVAQARDRLVEAERHAAEERRARDAAAATRDAAARDLGIADRLDDLEALEDAVAAYRRSLAALWPELRAHLAARRAAAAAGERLGDAVAQEDGRRRRLEEARERRRTAEAERQVLERNLGAGVEQILERLAAARSLAAELRARRGAADARREELLTARARAEQEAESRQQVLERDAGERDRAVAALRRLAACGLVPVAAPKVTVDDDPESWSVTRAVDVARRLESVLGEVEADDAAWERQQRDVHRRFQTLNETLLPHGYQPSLDVEDDLFVVRAPFQGRQLAMDAFRTALADDVAYRDRVLAEREREVIENHLIGEVALHLHDRLRAAEELVGRMNGQIESRPTSAGMKLRFRWQPLTDEHPNLAAARRLLMAEHGVWSPPERQAVGEFLQGLIRKEWAENETGTWQEHLARALDYRAWHQFSVERHQDGQWRKLTRRTHGTGSGGEKAIALTMPQFAAAAAHYDTADPRAPRLILLDEAFVGVDADMRSKCMGLLVAFDLDFVMTSEREWGCYPTLPGLAIYHLSARPGIDAVGVTRWLWNGRERLRDDRPPPPPAAVEEPAGELVSGLLFDRS